MLFFEVKIIFFWCAGNFLLIAHYKLLPPYGVSFATFWWKFCSVLQEKNFKRTLQTFATLWRKFCCVLLSSVIFLKRSTKVCCIFLGVCVCVSMDNSRLLSKTL
jgi:hypothetical protein